MFITIIRTLILYALLLLIMRIMGKRQIGQLQTGELVITIMISEIAAIPLQDNDLPMINSIIAVLLLAAFEIIVSAISMKSIKIRDLLQGNAVIIIRNGVLDIEKLKSLRYTVDDVMEALRQKDVFRLDDVQYAVAETNGSLSVLLKPDKRDVTSGEMKIKKDPSGLECIIISDGRIIQSNFKDCNMTEKKLFSLLKKKNLNHKDIMLMTSDVFGNLNIIKKEEKQ